MQSILKEEDTHLYSNNFNINHPELIILEHNSLAEEKFAKNGIQKNVHVVVKNTPFHISVGFNNNINNNLNFNHVTVEALLMYDCDGERFVDFVNVKPLEYKGNINDSADKMTLEIRLKKLSSHLEDMFFKIRIKGIDSKTKEDIPHLFTTSQPIKVVSKPEQVERIKQLQSGKKPTTIKKTPRKRKRTVNDMMYESIQNIEKRQEEQKELLQKILSLKSNNELTNDSLASILPNTKDTNNTNTNNDNNNSTNTSKKKKGVTTDLEEALNNLIYAYENTDPIERPLKIRKVARNSTISSTTNIIEILTQLQSNLPLHTQTSFDSTNLSYSFDSSLQPKQDDLAYSNDLERIDEFYRDLLLPNSF